MRYISSHTRCVFSPSEKGVELPCVASESAPKCNWLGESVIDSTRFTHQSFWCLALQTYRRLYKKTEIRLFPMMINKKNGHIMSLSVDITMVRIAYMIYCIWVFYSGRKRRKLIKTSLKCRKRVFPMFFTHSKGRSKDQSQND